MTMKLRIPQATKKRGYVNNIAISQLRCVIVGQVYRSQQNGMVYDPNGISPCICMGHHAGVEPRIIEYVQGESHL